MEIIIDGKNNQRIVWHGKYRGISWEISAKKSYDSERSNKKLDWCHYIFIGLEQLPEANRDSFWLPARIDTVSKRKRVDYNYFDSPLAELAWHGEITFYEKIGGVDGELRTIKAGCDYQHSWDDGINYNFDYVLIEAKLTIDSLHDQVAGIRIWCNDGYCAKEWHLEKEGAYHATNKDFFRCKFCHDKRIIEQQEE